MPFQMYMDADGVPYSDYGEYRGLEIGRQRSVLAVAERGLFYWNQFLREHEHPVLLSYDWKRWPVNFEEFRPGSMVEAQRMLINCANWLRSNLKIYDGFSVWEYPYPFSYQTGPGWRSAHAQAVSLQLLVRAEELTSKHSFVADLSQCLAAFKVDIRDGGLSTKTDAGNIWFEKMADKDNQQPKVLNGLLFSILGLKDVSDRTGNTLAQNLVEQGTAAAIELLPKFDLGDWSSYDIYGKRASPHYHSIHIEQLKLFSHTNTIFKQYYERFKSYT